MVSTVSHLPVNLVFEALGVWRGIQEGQPQQEPWLPQGRICKVPQSLPKREVTT